MTAMMQDPKASAEVKKEAITCYQKILMDAHYTVFIRQSRGEDISAACGQLAGRTQRTQEKR